ncbi:MAG: molybdopterin-dependent oxidoreductase, partial [Eggerthellaceae bacterium]|nr:molybdopterin-dependent oxidoreductase [Eggerthellaceae bacterium]
MTRRSFVQRSALAGLAVGVAGLGLAACSPSEPEQQEQASPATGYQYEAETAEGQWVHSACQRNCFDTCMMMCKVVDGQIVQVRGDESNPYTAGGLCVKTQNYVDYIYSDDRILYPMKRTGKKGPGCTFERISWDDAVAEITGKWKEIIEQYGGEAITWSRYQGNQGAVHRRNMEPLFYKMGATFCDGTMCNNGYVNSLPYTTGGITVMRPEEIPSRDLYVSWSHNPANTSLHTMKFIKELHKNGGRIVVVNPIATPETMWAELHVQLCPGTDVAFAMGVAKYLLDNGKFDQAFIDEWSIGFEDYQAAVQEWTVEKTAETCRIPAEQIGQFADIIWENRANMLLKTGLQLGRRINGGMSHIAVKLLTGLIGHPECYFNMTSSGGYNNNATAMTAAMLDATLPSESVPVGSIRNWSSPDLGKVLTSQNYGEDHNFADNPIRSIYFFGNNAMVSNPNIELVAQGLSREDLFTIVHDVYMTPTCEYADIILPAPTGFEYEEFNGGYGHNYDVVSPQVIEPLGECKDNNEVCNLLGAAMGFTDEAFTRDKQWYRNLFLEGKAYTWEEISQAGWVDVPPTTWEAQLEAGYGTPSAKFQFACDELEANHGTRTVRYVPDEESINGDAELLAKYPISLLTPSAKEFLNGVMGNLADNNALFFENYVYLNQEDASERGIADGDAVRVFNDRGSVNRVARVIDGITSVKTA